MMQESKFADKTKDLEEKTINFARMAESALYADFSSSARGLGEQAATEKLRREGLNEIKYLLCKVLQPDR